MASDLPDEVWVADIHGGHGENFRVLGVYESREAAWDALSADPRMTVYEDYHGNLRGRPRDTSAIGPWASARPMPIRGRSARVIIPVTQRLRQSARVVSDAGQPTPTGNPLRAFARAVLSGEVAADDETTEALKKAEEIEGRREAR